VRVIAYLTWDFGVFWQPVIHLVKLFMVSPTAVFWLKYEQLPRTVFLELLGSENTSAAVACACVLFVPTYEFLGLAPYRIHSLLVG
jgi:hypothetical protein